MEKMMLLNKTEITPLRKKQNDRLAASEVRYRRLFETAKDGILILEADTGKIIDANPFLLKLLGYSEKELYGMQLWQIGLFSDIESNKEAFNELQQNGYVRYEDLPLRTKDGSSVAVEFVSNSYMVELDKVIQCNIRDITKRKQTEAELRKNQEKCVSIINNINEYYYSLDYSPDRIVAIYHSPQCLQVTGYSEEELRGDGMLWLSMIHKDDRDKILECLADCDAAKKCLPVQHRIIKKDGTEKWVINNLTTQPGKNGDPLRLNGSMLDVTDLKATQENNAFLAHYDPLTKLPNRNMLYNRLEKSVQLARREKKHLALLFLDLDNFKTINDSLGHDAGDKVLAEMARQFSTFVRAGDTVARWGGDEFVIILWDCGVDGAAYIADKLTCAAVKVEGIDATVGMSAGISVFPEDGEDYQALLKNADIAMYHAKNSGRRKYEFFTPAMNIRVKERSHLATEIRNALDFNQLVLFYQPRINMETGKISGVEALLRWQHPEKGFVLPGDFLPVAIESGLIRRISEWVILNACRQINLWQHHKVNVPVSVNITPAYFLSKDFEDYLRAILWETRISPDSLELEMKEDLIMSDPLKVFEKLTSMKSLGIKLTIDDYGTGFSSLLFLQKNAVEKLKIDQTFVKNLAQKTDRDLIHAMISVGHSMNVIVVAEGIENAEQFAFLKHEGCDEGQGYYFCRPMPADELTLLLTGDTRWTDSGAGLAHWDAALRHEQEISSA